jgi:hypothetical protein
MILVHPCVVRYRGRTSDGILAFQRIHRPHCESTVRRPGEELASARHKGFHRGISTYVGLSPPPLYVPHPDGPVIAGTEDTRVDTYQGIDRPLVPANHGSALFIWGTLHWGFPLSRDPQSLSLHAKTRSPTRYC